MVQGAGVRSVFERGVQAPRIKYISMYSLFSDRSDKLVILALALVSMYLTIDH